jgi:hypothetical protein
VDVHRLFRERTIIVKIIPTIPIAEIMGANMEKIVMYPGFAASLIDGYVS